MSARAAAVAAFLLSGFPILAGVVQTRTGRLSGAVSVRDGALAVDGKVVPVKDVLFAVFDAPGRTFRSPNTVRLTSGEVWHCEVLALQAGKLKLRSPYFGTKEVAREGVRSLEFREKVPPEEGLGADTLYREEGEPLPGKLLWISSTQVAVDSPLGAMAMDRSEVTRFILSKAAPAAATTGHCEVALCDGSVVRGTLKLAAGEVVVTHEELGELAVPVRAVRSLLCHAPGCVYLAEMALDTAASPLLAATPSIRTVHRRAGGQADAAAGYVRALVIQPSTKLTVRLPGKAPGVFRATVSAVDAARGPARLRITAGGKALIARTVEPSVGPPEAISVELTGETMAIEVLFEDTPKFPCGVVLGDPHVVRP